MESIVVTGGTGFVGSHLTRRLLLSRQKRCKRIVIIDNSDKVSKGRIPSLNGISFDDRYLGIYKEDIRDKDAILNILKSERPVGTFIHLASKGNVHGSNVKPQEISDVNVNGTRNALEACSANDVGRFVFASSAAVYGEAKELPLSENHPLLPLSDYGHGKARAEELVSTYMLTGKIQSTISLRIFNIYGEGDRNGVISKFSRRLGSGLSPIVYGNGKQVRDFISVNDVINALLLASSSREGGEFNVGTGRPILIDELARKMIKIYGLELEPIYSRGEGGENDTNVGQEIKQSYADTSKSANLLNFIARANIDSELKEMRRILLR